MWVLGRFCEIGRKSAGKQIQANPSAERILTRRKVFLYEIFGNDSDWIDASDVRLIEIATFQKGNAESAEIGVADKIDSNFSSGRRQSVNIEFRWGARIGRHSGKGCSC